MGLLSKPIQPREFKFRPQYYDPQKDDEEQDGKPKIEFRRVLRHPFPPKRPVTRYLVLLVLLTFIFWYVRAQFLDRVIKVEHIRVEDINP